MAVPITIIPNNLYAKSVLAQIAGGLDSENAHIATLPNGKYKDQASEDQYRSGYKIFICGEHEEGTPVYNLPWASEYGPSGLRNESNGIRVLPPNTYVKVSRDGTMDGVPFYWIVEVLPNYNVKLDPKIETKCGSGSGFCPGSENYPVSEDCLLPEGNGIAPGCEANISVPCRADDNQDTDNESRIIPVPIECKKVDTAAINKELGNLIKGVQDARKGLLGEDSFIRTSSKFLASVEKLQNKASEFVSNQIAWLINEIRQFVMRKVNVVVNNTIGNAYLNLRYQILEVNETALELLSCLFLKILNNLTNIVRKFLNSFINQYLNTGLCVIETFLSELLGNIMAQLKNALSQILGPLQNLLGSAVNLIDSVLGFAESILDFLTCDIDQLCPVVNEWNFLEGGLDSSSATIPNLDFDRIFSSAKAFGDNLISLGDIPSNLLNTNFDINLESVLSASEGCLGGIGGGLFKCGPPKVVFWGGGGSGANGNVVVNAFSEIIGVNIIEPGTGYTSPPTVQFEDNCGHGVGADGISVLSGGGGVDHVIIKNNGYNYLPNPDGSYGGNDRVFVSRCQSAIRRGDTNYWEGPFNEGEVIKINIGDFVIIAGQPPYTSEENTTMTAPGCPPENNNANNNENNNEGDISVVTDIINIDIINGGFNYGDNDTISIVPDNGAIIEPIISNGVVTGVNIINPGIGFDRLPNITINTSTGYNATLNAVLGFRSVDDIEFELPQGTKIVSVIDCVGKN